MEANYKFKCQNCGEDVLVEQIEEKDANYPCSKCGDTNFTLYREALSSFEKIGESSSVDADVLNEDKDDKYNYPTLSFISGTYAFLAYVSIFGAIIYFLILNSNVPSYGNSNAGALILLSAIAIGLGGYIFFMLFAEGIKLFVNISRDLGDIKKKLK